MNKVAQGLIWIVVLVALVMAGWRTHQKIQEHRSLQTADEGSPEVLRVGVQLVTAETLVNSVSVMGEVKAMAVVDVVPKIAGQLEKLRLPGGELIEVGAVVEKGQVIAVIEHSALQAAVDLAAAALARARIQAKPEVIDSKIKAVEAAAAAARAGLAEMEANLRHLGKEKKRMIELFQTGSATEQLRDRAVTAYETMQEKQKAVCAQVEQAGTAVVLVRAQTRELAEAAVAQAEAGLRQARIMLDEATIEAPAAGIVSEKYIDEGNMVGPGRALGRIVQIDTVKVVGHVSERHLAFLVPGKTTISFSVDAYPGEQFEGLVDKVGVALDSRTHTAEVEVRIGNPDHRLKPGMFARLQLVLDRRENVTAVSDAALIRQGEEVCAYLVDSSVVHRRVLKLGISQGELHQVLDGLAPGDQVIVRGHRLVKDGDRVEVVGEGRQ